MHELVWLGAILGALAVGVVSPGPSFVMIAREALATSRNNALAAALGMGLGGTLFALAALLGLQTMLLALPAVYLALKTLGGLYLCYIGGRIYLSAKLPLSLPKEGNPGTTRSARASFCLGLSTQLSNPKTAVVYASVFAALLPAHFSPSSSLVLVVLVFVLEAGWYAVVATLLSASAPRRTYTGLKPWVDRVAGLVMVGLGLRLILTAHKA
jgi:threonine/homoserine/homoserine lactone efflux protein